MLHYLAHPLHETCKTCYAVYYACFLHQHWMNVEYKAIYEASQGCIAQTVPSMFTSLIFLHSSEQITRSGGCLEGKAHQDQR